MRNAHPNIGDKWTDDNGIELEYVAQNQWVKVGTDGYVRIKRAQEYPSVEDQLDMLYHEITANGSISATGDWYQTITSVKTNNPKPE